MITEGRVYPRQVIFARIQKIKWIESSFLYKDIRSEFSDRLSCSFPKMVDGIQEPRENAIIIELGADREWFRKRERGIEVGSSLTGEKITWFGFPVGIKEIADATVGN